MGIRTALLAFCLVITSPLAAAEFKFVALGDMPYGPAERVYPPFRTLIETINNRAPAFTLHIGDTKSSRTPCSNEVLDQQRDFLNSFTHPLIYTPGDNEWTDCYFERSGGFDPRERLDYIRKTYFTKPETSFGTPSMEVDSQAVVMAEAYSDFPENTSFEKEGVHFVQAHVVGSNNGFEAHDPESVAEFFRRDAANVAWLNRAFDHAERDGAVAMVVSIHANMFEFAFGSPRNREDFLRHSGFKRFGDVLVARAHAFQKPVLLIYGDSHKYNIWRPFPRRAPNVTGLEVFGARDMHAVEVSVDTKDAAVFGMRPVLNPALKDPS